MSERTGRRRSRSFVPAVLAGLSGAGLAAVAGSRTWARGAGDAAGLRVEASVTGSESQPLAVALALVALAAWGVLLVVRGRPRRFVAALGLVASCGGLAAVVVGFGSARDDAVDAAVAQGAGGGAVQTALTAWYYLAGLGALVAACALAVAVVAAPGWPGMGSRYDAPGARREAPVSDEDMWRALDEGQDPTS